MTPPAVRCRVLSGFPRVRSCPLIRCFPTSPVRVQGGALRAAPRRLWPAAGGPLLLVRLGVR